MTNAMLRRANLLGCVMLSFVALSASPVFAQYNGYPARYTYHPEHGYVPVAGYGGYGGYGGMTPQMGAGIGYGAAASGLGDLASGIGQMHQANAQAQIAHQQAQTEYLKNKNLANQTALEITDRQRKATEENIARQSAEEKERMAAYHKTLDQMAAAHRLTAEQFDMTRNVLHWPFALRGPEYMDLRMKLDQLYASRTPDDSGTNSDNYGPIKEACSQMLGIVKGEVKKGMSVTDFVTAQHFISSIEYEARFPVQATK